MICAAQSEINAAKQAVTTLMQSGARTWRRTVDAVSDAAVHGPVSLAAADSPSLLAVSIVIALATGVMRHTKH